MIAFDPQGPIVTIISSVNPTGSNAPQLVQSPDNVNDMQVRIVNVDASNDAVLYFANAANQVTALGVSLASVLASNGGSVIAQHNATTVVTLGPNIYASAYPLAGNPTLYVQQGYGKN